jgi:hypothetical protein
VTALAADHLIVELRAALRAAARLELHDKLRAGPRLHDRRSYTYRFQMGETFHSKRFSFSRQGRRRHSPPGHPDVNLSYGWVVSTILVEPILDFILVHVANRLQESFHGRASLRRFGFDAPMNGLG